jgi:Ca2+-binding RTX toxin-like protein
LVDSVTVVLANDRVSPAAANHCSVDGEGKRPGDHETAEERRPEANITEPCLHRTRNGGGDGDDHLTSVGDEDKLFGEGGDDLFEGTGGYNSGTAPGVPVWTPLARPMVVCRETDEGIDYSWNGSGWVPNRRVDVERFIGSAYADVMEGTSGRDVLLGIEGPDTLIDLSGRDELRGGPGRDRFSTRDNRSDTIRGGLGRDRGRVDGSDVLISARAVSTAYTSPCDG